MRIEGANQSMHFNHNGGDDVDHTQISGLYLIHYELSENHKKIISVLHSVLG